MIFDGRGAIFVTEVIDAENTANLNALDSQWERRKKELLVQKAAARLKKDSKREQVEKAKLKKLTAANDGSLMADSIPSNAHCCRN